MKNSVSDIYPAEGAAGVCMASLIPLRKAPREQSEMISQLLFGEYYMIEKVLDRWLKITTIFDIYEGWIDRKFFRATGLVEGRDSLKNQTVLCQKLAEIEMPDGSIQLIAAGSSLYYYEQAKGEFRIGKQKFRIRPLFGDTLLPASQQITETAVRFLNTPYLWGGRSVFGCDCAGFIQTLYKIHGIFLPRDTSMQVLSGQPLPSPKDAAPGDLAFFCDEEGRAIHVGMILPNNEIIHCSGWVRVDRLDEKGIFDREQGVYTHRLMEVRRVFGNQ